MTLKQRPTLPASKSGQKTRHDKCNQLRKVKRKEDISSARLNKNIKRPDEEEVPDMLLTDLHIDAQSAYSARMKEKLELLPSYVEGIYSTDFQHVLTNTENIRKILSIERRPPITEVVNSGIIPRLVTFLKEEESKELQFEASWALTNICSGTTEQTRMVIDCGAIPRFVKLLSSPNVDVREQAIWAIGNIAGDSVSYRNMVLESGAMPILLNPLLNPEELKLSILRNSAWALSNFCRGKPAPPFTTIKPMIGVAARLLTMVDVDTLCDTCWCLSYIVDAGSAEYIEAVFASGCLPKLIQHLEHTEAVVSVAAVRVMENILYNGTDEQVETLIQAGLLTQLTALLRRNETSVVKEACSAIQSLAFGEVPEHIGLLIELDVIRELVKLSVRPLSDATEALLGIIRSATSEQVKTICDNQDVFRCFSQAFQFPDQYDLMLFLDALEWILKNGTNSTDITDKMNEQNVDMILSLESLTKKPSYPAVSQKANKILEEYFIA